MKTSVKYYGLAVGP